MERAKTYSIPMAAMRSGCCARLWVELRIGILLECGEFASDLGISYATAYAAGRRLTTQQSAGLKKRQVDRK